MSAVRDRGRTGVSDETRQLRDLVEAALADHDRPTAVRVAVEAVSRRRVGVAELYRDVLRPVLVGLGARWQTGERRVWEEHLASATVRTIVELVYPEVLRLKAAAKSCGGSVLLACPPQEAHDLGLRMVADRFEMAGWTVHFLGADTPADELVDAARKVGVDAVALSSSTHYHRLAVRHLVDELKQRLPEVKVWVGGAAFVRDREGWTDDELVDLDALLGDVGECPDDATSGGERPDGAARE